VKTLAFAIGLCILIVGVVGVLAPANLVWIAQHFDNPVEWYVLGVVRIALGVLLFSVARASRAPLLLRVVGVIALLAGFGALLTPSLGIDRAQATLQWWSQLASGYIRLTALAVVVLGGVIAYACAPAQRAA
jgi:hypothetical protein